MASNPTPLTRRQRRGLDRVGDCYFPGNDEFPSFSTCGCGDLVGIPLETLPSGDRSSLLTLLGILGSLPGWVTRLLVSLAERGGKAPGFIGAGCRFLRMGLRGVTTSLYYSGEVGSQYQGPTPLEVIDYRVTVYTGDVEGRDPSQGSVAACRGLHSSGA